MKIVSRPNENIDQVAIGSGGITLKLTDTQLELVAALMYQCRLGTAASYSNEAFQIINMIEGQFGTDFMEDASAFVDLQVTIEDDMGNVVFSTKSGNYFATLEV